MAPRTLFYIWWELLLLLYIKTCPYIKTFLPFSWKGLIFFPNRILTAQRPLGLFTSKASENHSKNLKTILPMILWFFHNFGSNSCLWFWHLFPQSTIQCVPRNWEKKQLYTLGLLLYMTQKIKLTFPSFILRILYQTKQFHQNDPSEDKNI